MRTKIYLLGANNNAGFSLAHFPRVDGLDKTSLPRFCLKGATSNYRSLATEI